eukprot:jgi/Bigna1/86794/estExt_fgenesh1_pg.C_140011
MLSPRTHNFVSYAGAAAVLALLWPYSKSSASKSVGFVMWVAHFARRALETVFVFHFSGSIVPVADSAQEFAYYWLFAAWISQSISRVAPISEQPRMAQILHLAGVAIWATSQYANHCCHRSLARNKDKSRRVSSGGYLFDIVTCPHYFFEILSWVGFNLATHFTVPGVLFASAGSVIMTCWAAQKHQRYQSVKSTASTRHTAIFPFVDFKPPHWLVDSLAKVA